jgi:hypothetical protein
MTFDTNEILNNLQNINFSEDAKIKLEKLRKELYYVAPEYLGERFFNGYKSTDGLCAILQRYTTDDIEAEVQTKYNEIVESYIKWTQRYD